MNLNTSESAKGDIDYVNSVKQVLIREFLLFMKWSLKILRTQTWATCYEKKHNFKKDLC